MKKLLLIAIMMMATFTQLHAQTEGDSIVVKGEHFTFVAKNIQFYTFEYDVIPNDTSMRYILTVREKLALDTLAHGGTDEDIYNWELEYYTWVGEIYEKPWEDFMQNATFQGVHSGDCFNEFGALSYGKENVLYAFGINEGCERITPVERIVVSTLGPTPVDMTFKVDINEVTRTSVDATITPSVDNEPYYVNVQSYYFTESYMESDSMINVMADKLVRGCLPQDMYPYNWQAGGVSYITPDIVTLNSFRKKYYIIVFGFRNGPTTPIYLFPFYTDEAAGIDGIEAKEEESLSPVYGLDGRLVAPSSDAATMKQLRSGCYIINKRKVLVK